MHGSGKGAVCRWLRASASKVRPQIRGVVASRARRVQPEHAIECVAGRKAVQAQLAANVLAFATVAHLLPPSAAEESLRITPGAPRTSSLLTGERDHPGIPRALPLTCWVSEAPCILRRSTSLSASNTLASNNLFCSRSAFASFTAASRPASPTSLRPLSSRSSASWANLRSVSSSFLCSDRRRRSDTSARSASALRRMASI